ncbi:MAG: hypothetical protein KA369_23190 [Spirochaetes bacterium]|nr:hypothetical protein [Spirochaetota bacterium]
MSKGMISAGICALMAWTVISCDRRVAVEIPKDAGILGETTVATVEGFRVGSGNYYRRVDGSGVKRKSIQIFVWRPDRKKDATAKETVVFEGDVFEIGDKKYRLLHVDEGKGGDTGKAYYVPVKP